jgi:hypothetical protein
MFSLSGLYQAPLWDPPWMADLSQRVHADGIIIGVFGDLGTLTPATSAYKPGQNIQIKEVTILGNKPNLTLNPSWTP